MTRQRTLTSICAEMGFCNLTVGETAWRARLCRAVCKILSMQSARKSRSHDIAPVMHSLLRAAQHSFALQMSISAQKLTRRYPKRGDALNRLEILTGVRRASAAMAQGMWIRVTKLNEVLTAANRCAVIAQPAEARRAPGPFSHEVKPVPLAESGDATL